ncbi:NAD-dependent protein deacylase [Leuconostoc lactis]|uniref:NAD-dependent protein deacylase n=1 Tax=Leuconostoc lactis TaxID=1246 RepID=UPI0028A05BD9|nr:NAD-dependent protein deacylase [Leuconostoc lactis]
MLVTPEIQAQFDTAKNIVFMTGAGISTPSGIPDYRSKNGLYQGNTLQPEYLLSATAFQVAPEMQYQFMKENMYFPDAAPNVIHDKMAQFTQKGQARIITQNVDDLHVKANTVASRLIRFHGSLYDIYAPVDQRPATVAEYLTSMRRADGALLRPRITFYEETPFAVDEAVTWVNQADLIVIVGTSFQVYPFAGLLQYAAAGTPILAINLTPIETSYPVTQIIGDATTFFDTLTV